MSEDKTTTEDPTPSNLDDEITSRIASMQQAEKDLYLRILFLFNQSEKYTAFVDETFDVHTAVNEETKTIDLVVIEKPTVKVVDDFNDESGFDVTKSLKLMMILKKLNVQEPSTVAQMIKNVFFGKEDENKIITSASEADVKKEVETQKAASKIIL